MSATTGRPVLIGERASVSGSCTFRGLVEAGRYADAADFACRQLTQGATMLDVSTAGGNVDEGGAMSSLLDAVRAHTAAPLLIDSPNPELLAAALPRCARPVWVNSIHLGLPRATIERVVALAREHGAGVVAGCGDDAGPARTGAAKVAIARRLVELLVGELGVASSDLMLDPLAFPCALDDGSSSARATIDAVLAITDQLGVATVVGVSDVSWQLARGRAIVDTVFLEHAAAAGLSHAIVDPRRVRGSAGDARTRALANDALFRPGPASIAEFVAAVTDPSQTVSPVRSTSIISTRCDVAATRTDS